jgi:hypothetical protein
MLTFSFISRTISERKRIRLLSIDNKKKIVPKRTSFGGCGERIAFRREQFHRVIVDIATAHRTLNFES